MAQASGKARRGKRGGKNRGKASSGAPSGRASEKAKLLKMLSSWDAARRSERRGKVILPNRDPKKNLTAHEREEIAGKVEAGEQNVGFVGRAISGAAGLIGHLTPQGASGNEDFDAEFDERFKARCDHPEAFDQSANFDFWGWQTWVEESKIRHGDALSALSEGPDGAARLICYEAPQIGNGTDRSERPSNLFDGVFLDRFGGRAAFRILDADGKPAGRIDRKRAIYHCRATRAGRVRQVSGLAHAVANFLDMVEILADTKHAVKVAALWGAWLETKVGAEGDDSMGEDLRALWETVAETADVLDEAGGDLGEDDLPEPPAPEPELDGQVMSVDDFVQGGRFQDFGAGKELKTMNDARPHPNIMGLLAWLIRDMAWGLPGGGISPEVLWDASKMSGPGMRFVMGETRRFIANAHKSLQRDCQRVRMYFGAKEIQRGALSQPAGLKCWYKATWIPQADITIDRGRDGNLELQQYEKNLVTPEDYWGSRGKDWKEQEEKILQQEKWKRDRRKLVLGE